MNKQKLKIGQTIVLGLLFAALLLFPQFAKQNYYVSVAVQVLVFASLATSWNILGATLVKFLGAMLHSWL
ncbi:MAG: hypothetical protein ACOX2A_05385 [Tepidanaerobacteraceae bacterium]